MMETPELVKTLYPRRYFTECIAKGIRSDERSLLQARNCVLHFDREQRIASVQFGKTLVKTTARVEVCESGGVEIRLEVTALCCFSKSKGQIFGKQLGSRLQSLFDSEFVVDQNSFSILNSTSCFHLVLDVAVLDADGSVFEAALLSCLALVKGLDLPVFEVDMNGLATLTADLDEGQRITLRCHPIAFTFGSFEGHLLSDPTEEEETVMDGLMTVVLDEHKTVLSAI